MKTKIKVLAIGAIFASFTACTDHYEELDFPKTTSAVIAPDPIFTRSLVTGSGMSVGIWQNTNQLTTLDWTQYVATIKSNFTQAHYEPGPQSAIWKWWYSEEAFAGLHLSEHAISLSQQVENPIHEAMARIWRAYMYQYMTDMFGDIPYTEAFKAIVPKYDTQESIYNDLISQLQTSVALLKDNRNSGYPTFGSADVLYGGNIDKWIKFGNSMLLRLAMQSSNVAENTISRPVLADIDFTDPSQFLSDNEDNAQIIPDSVGPTYHVKNPYAFVAGWEEMRISKTFFDRLDKNSDPRIPVFMAPNVDGEFVGLPNGQPIGALNAGYTDIYIPQYCDIGAYFLQGDSPFMLMSAAEINFLLAEAAHKGFIPGSASAFYDKAIALSMEQFGIAEADATTFITAVPFNEQNLYEQMWIALFPNGPQAWNLVRRTGKPDIAPLIYHWPENSEMPRRYSYSTDEVRYNPVNVKEAIDRMGGDTHYHRVWWDSNK